MNKYLLQTKDHIRKGEIFSGAGFVLYLVFSVLKVPAVFQFLVLLVFSLLSVWTLISLMVFTKDEEDGSPERNQVMGQLALAVLLVACLVLTAHSMIF